MLLFPHEQRKAQDELDRVIGRDRLPDFSDRNALPFVQSLMYETMRYIRIRGLYVMYCLLTLFISRWHPSVPLGTFSELFLS